uniref:VWFA domain-containing protein n=1 Tax=mine drainage metagenome TaxID=410659 RepID=E6PZP9_9ZZZZ
MPTPIQNLPVRPLQKRQPEQLKAHILLDVQIADKAGAPIQGLAPFDFTLLDNGVPQKLLGIQHAGISFASPHPPAELIILLDAVNCTFESMQLERQNVVNYLRRNGGRLNQPTTIVLLTDTELKIQPRPSMDGNALANAIEKSRNPVHTFHYAAGYAGELDREEWSLRNLSKLAIYETARPGRKLVLWISHGWPPLDQSDNYLSDFYLKGIFRNVVQLNNELLAARITLDAIDPRGPVSGVNHFYYLDYVKPLVSYTQARSPDLMLEVFATHTGGRVLDISTDILSEIDMCLSDLNSWYTLLYNAPPAIRQNQFHGITVRVNRPDAHTRTVSGYYSQPK